MAWISLAKLFLFLGCLILLMAGFFRQRSDMAWQRLWSTRMILLIVLAFAVSLLWSQASQDIAWLAFVKHGKLLEIVMLIALICNQREARMAIAAFMISQVVLIASSWSLAMGWPVPWATGAVAQFAVFSSYLDQSIIFATTAAIFWHLRSELFLPQAPWLNSVVASAALANTLFLLDGRTGYAVALALLTFAGLWNVPRKMRLIFLIVVPVLLVTGAYLSSDKVQSRLTAVVSESQNYADQGGVESSSGFRLNAWRRSLQAIAQAPMTGFGVGAWTVTVKQIEGAGAGAEKIFGRGNASNPHQEYLLWGVELGVGGIVILSLLLGSLVRDAFAFPPPVMRATVSVILAMAVACLFNSSLYDAMIGDYFCVALGLLMALGIRSKPTSSMSTGSGMNGLHL